MTGAAVDLRLQGECPPEIRARLLALRDVMMFALPMGAWVSVGGAAVAVSVVWGESTAERSQ